MANILPCIRDDYVKKNGKCLVFLQIHIKRRKVVVGTDLSVDPEKWDYENRCVHSGVQGARDLNLILGRSITRANEILIRYRLMEKPLNPKKFKEEWKNPANHIDFLQWMQEEIKSRRGAISEATFKMHNSILSRLKEFRPAITFADVDEKFLSEYDKWEKVTNHNRMNTRHKKMRTLKTYLNIALARGIIRENPFRTMKISRGKASPVFLSAGELRSLIELYHKPLLMPHHHRVLHYFLFACFTGLRISDVKRLTWDRIIDNSIIIPVKKLQNVNEAIVRIPLEISARVLIDLDHAKFKKGKVFECMTDQRTNFYLKEIMTLAKVKKSVSFHVARHTFASLFYEKTNDLLSLKEILGHSSISQTMVYAHLNERKKREQMRSFDEDYAELFRRSQ